MFFFVKLELLIFTAVRTPCHQNLKYENFTSSFGGLRQGIAPMSVLHLQDDNFLIQSIKSLICNVVVAVAVGDRFFNSLLLSNWNARGVTLRRMTRELPKIHL